jgi:hypothetical protein
VKEIDVMSARALLARALAAVAVTGLAVAGPALSAGAATGPPPAVSLAPSGVTVAVGTRPVVTVGAPTPAPGVHATVPASGDANASVGRPDQPVAPLTPPIATPTPGAAAPLLAPMSSAARLVDADLSLRLCLAAALLGGRADGCASPASSGPSLADAVARTFLCARVAVLGADGAAACDVGDPAGPDGAVPRALLGTDAATGACLTATVDGAADPSRCGAAGSGTPPTSPAGTEGATAELGSSACAVIAVLGGATGCAGTASESTGPAGADGRTAASSVDACVALAALSSDASPACPTTSPTGTPGGGDPRSTPVLVTAPTATPGSTVFGAELTRTTGGSGSAAPHGDLAFSGADSLFLTLSGLGAITVGTVLRRAGRLGTVR